MPARNIFPHYCIFLDNLDCLAFISSRPILFDVISERHHEIVQLNKNHPKKMWWIIVNLKNWKSWFCEPFLHKCDTANVFIDKCWCHEICVVHLFRQLFQQNCPKFTFKCVNISRVTSQRLKPNETYVQIRPILNCLEPFLWPKHVPSYEFCSEVVAVFVILKN